MKLSIQNILINKSSYKAISVIVITVLNLLFIILSLFLLNFLFLYGIKGEYLLLLFIFFLLSVLPILNFFLYKLGSLITPEGDIDLYIKTIDSIINTESFDEIIYKVFDLIIKLLKAGFGQIIYYRDNGDVLDIKYVKNRTREISVREERESDKILLTHIHGPDDIIIKAKDRKSADKNSEIAWAMETLNAEIIVPLYYNNKVFGLVTIGQKKGFTEKEINLLKITAFKLAIVSTNSYHFNEIIKRREVEKEYELTNKIQKQFLPEPSLEYGRISVKAYHNTASSLTREFYDIFMNDGLSDDIRISAYRVSGDVKETSIFMPGIQAILQCYTRLGFSPKKTLSKLINLEREMGVLNGNLMIFHSSIKQSGEFICCYSDYPAPFYYHKKIKKLVHLEGKGRKPKSVAVRMNPGDIIIAACRNYYEIINANMEKCSDIINKNRLIPLDEIKNSLIKIINEFNKTETDNTYNQIEGEDKLLILIAISEAN